MRVLRRKRIALMTVETNTRERRTLESPLAVLHRVTRIAGRRRGCGRKFTSPPTRIFSFSLPRGDQHDFVSARRGA